MLRSLKTKFFQKLRAFARSEEGMTLPLLALSLVTLTTFTGLAIDVGRVQMVQSKLQFSVDAAGLAAGATVSTAATEAEFVKYLNVNFNHYMGATITGHSVTPNSTNTIFTMSASATVPTTFMGIVGIRYVSLTATSEISRAITGLELVFVLDNTGSMSESAGGSVTKIQALKTAANTLINTLFGGETTMTNGKLWIGIVPFSQAVNIGTSHSSWIDQSYTYDGTTDGYGSLDWGPGNSWVGCVNSRRNGLDITDDPPNTSTPNTLFGQYYWTSDNLSTDSWAGGGNNWKLKNYTKCVYTQWGCTWSGCPTSCSTTTSCGHSYASCTFDGTYSYASPLNTSSHGPNLNCPQEVTRMTNTTTTLTTAINAMTAQGNTEISEGLAWAWRMLSPRWRGIWGGLMDGNNLPLDYHARGMAKAIVVLTDGQNTISDGAHGSYWYESSHRLGSSSLDAKTLALCTAMKNDDIYIYTIGLGASGINTSLLRGCATAVNYYFASPTTSQLQTVFDTIGDSLSNLRVSK